MLHGVAKEKILRKPKQYPSIGCLEETHLRAKDTSGEIYLIQTETTRKWR